MDDIDPTSFADALWPQIPDVALAANRKAYTEQVNAIVFEVRNRIKQLKQRIAKEAVNERR